jgi:hypothetical protein
MLLAPEAKRASPGLGPQPGGGIRPQPDSHGGTSSRKARRPMISPAGHTVTSSEATQYSGDVFRLVNPPPG